MSRWNFQSPYFLSDPEDPASSSAVPALALTGLTFVADPLSEDKRVLPEGSSAPPPPAAVAAKPGNHSFSLSSIA
jgi:hypothetical protein